MPPGQQLEHMTWMLKVCKLHTSSTLMHYTHTHTPTHRVLFSVILVYRFSQKAVAVSTLFNLKLSSSNAIQTRTGTLRWQWNHVCVCVRVCVCSRSVKMSFVIRPHTLGNSATAFPCGITWERFYFSNNGTLGFNCLSVTVLKVINLSLCASSVVIFTTHWIKVHFFSHEIYSFLLTVVAEVIVRVDNI